MANVKIIDLPTGSPESDSFLEATQVNEQAASGRSSAKIAFNALANWIAGQGADPVEYGDLNTEDETLIGGINELHDTIGADAYDDTATYNTGDYCIHNSELYKCNEDNVTGAWNVAKWDLTKVVDELGGGGGSSTLAGLSDVNLTNPADGQLLRYNGTSGKWENAGIINDTTASTSSVYSSNKVDDLLSDKANSADVYKKTDFAIKTASVSTTTVAASDLATVDITVNDSKMNIVTGFGIADSVSVVAVQVWFTSSTNIRLRVRNVSNASATFSAYIKYI